MNQPDSSTSLPPQPQPQPQRPPPPPLFRPRGYSWLREDPNPSPHPNPNPHPHPHPNPNPLAAATCAPSTTSTSASADAVAAASAAAGTAATTSHHDREDGTGTGTGTGAGTGAGTETGRHHRRGWGDGRQGAERREADAFLQAERAEGSGGSTRSSLRELFGGGGHNRISSLLVYDACCFGLAWLLFASGIVLIADDESRYAGLGASWALLRQPTTWLSWRAAATHYVCLRVFFPLTALPFMPFMVPALDKLLSRTSPTGYDQRGVAVPLNVRGVSAYVSWLELFLSGRGARAHLTAAERSLLERAAQQARAHVDRHHHEARPLEARRRAELDALLTAILPPSHPLYEAVFPDRLLCAAFERRLLAARALPSKRVKQQQAREAMGRKFGVDWQPDQSSSACRLCSGKWSLLRRRHHCRACGQLVCDRCSLTRQSVSSGGTTLANQRVCDHCVLRGRTDSEHPAAQP